MDRMRKAALLSGGAVLVWAGVASAQDPAAAPPVTTPTVGATVTVGTETAAAAAAPSAASEVDLGKPGTFVIDQVSGFRGRVGGGVGFYGPLGVAYNSFSGATGQQLLTSGNTITGAVSSETTIRSWSIWLAPSIDYFLVENLSIGGLFAVDTTFGSFERKTTTQPANTVRTDEGDLPTVTSFTLMPRIGYFLRVYSDRVSLWPRVGLGYFSGTNAAIESAGAGVVTRSTNVQALLVQLDLGLIYQITDNVFFRIAPAVTFSTNGSSTVKYKNAPAGSNLKDNEGDGSAFQFELTSGFGANFNL